LRGQKLPEIPLKYPEEKRGISAIFERMGNVRIFPRRWGVVLAVLSHTCLGWAQTLAPISDQTYLAGATNLPVTLTMSGFQTSQTLRTVAANITSGTGQKYEGPGTRIFQGLKPDIVMIQEFNIGGNSLTEIRDWVDSTFGAEFSYFRESYGTIPNGVISRWPILQSGSWDDGPQGVSDRGFAWARIDIPGPRNLWVVSLHLKASSGDANRRDSQARTLVALIQANVPADDYLLIGGDCNTYNYSEACLATLSSVVDVSAPRPADQANDPDTNANRNSPYDWVMAEPELDALEVPVTIGSLSFPSGLVFDSRVFSPLSLVSPVQTGDSGATNMQHMAVVRSFRVNAPEGVTVQVQSSNATLLPAGNIEVLGSGLDRSLRITPAAGQTGSSTVTVTVSDGAFSDSQNFTVTVQGAASSFASWAGYGAVTNEELVGKYAIGGATNTAALGESPVAFLDGNKLSLTAIVRTNDAKLAVVGVTGSNLTNWSTSGVSVTASTNTNGVPAGCQRQVFSVDRTNSPVRLFLRLKATLAP